MTEEEFRELFVTIRIPGILRRNIAVPNVCIHCGQPINGKTRMQKLENSTSYYASEVLVETLELPSCAECHQGLLSRGKRTKEGFLAPKVFLNINGYVEGLHRDFADAFQKSNASRLAEFPSEPQDIEVKCSVSPRCWRR